MADTQISSEATKGKPHSLFDNEVLQGIFRAHEFADKTYDRLEVIRYGLQQGGMNAVPGAVTLLTDIMVLMFEENQRLEALEATARNTANFLPRTEYEASLLAGMASAGEALESNFMCRAGLLAQHVYRGDRWGSPRVKDLGEVLRRAWAELEVTEDDPASLIHDTNVYAPDGAATSDERGETGHVES